MVCLGNIKVGTLHKGDNDDDDDDNNNNNKYENSSNNLREPGTWWPCGFPM
jgi:hypothetical protein